MTNTPRPSGAEVMLDILRNYNIEYLFASPGSEWPPLWEQLAKQKAQGRPGPQYINTRHETLAIGMAMGYAKVTGRLPVVLLHTTVGALHGAMALRAAYHEQTPMLVCAGESVGFGEGGGDYVGFQWQRFLSDRGGLGLGMGIALGVKSAAPHKLVMSLIGDGSFNYNPIVPAFGCAQEHQLPTLTILFNNQSYLSMKLGVQHLYPKGWAVQTDTFYGAPITPHPDYGALARAFGGYGEMVEDPEHVRPTLQRAIEAVRGGQAALVDVVLAE
jgi:thiamine pyrophosphate-dependent acetolactate synthase large subunit-like protein